MLCRSIGLTGLWRAPRCLLATTQSRWACVCSRRIRPAMFALAQVLWRHGWMAQHAAGMLLGTGCVQHVLHICPVLAATPAVLHSAVRVGQHRWVHQLGCQKTATLLCGLARRAMCILFCAHGWRRSRTSTSPTPHAPTLLHRTVPTSPPCAGCDSVSLAVQPGLPNTPGAAFLLNITWNPKAGLLLPSGENAAPALFFGK